MKFVAADPATGDVTIAAQIAAQTLGPEFKQWLNDPQKLLQLIAAAEGAKGGGGGEPGGAPIGSVPTVRMSGGGGGGGGGTGTGTGTGTGGGTWDGKTVPLQEEEVVQAIRLLTRFSEVSTNPNVAPEDLQKELGAADPNTRVNLQHLLESLASNVQTDNDTPLLMKAAEHMAIRFALERYQKGEVKVNAVHQMLEHMSRQMDTLRQILRVQEEKMGKAGILVESHADILDRMFWAEVPEAGKKSVLTSNEAPCVPPRNVRQFVEVLLERGDKAGADEILRNYFNCLDAKDAEPRRKIATGLGAVGGPVSGAGRRSDGLRHPTRGRTDLQGAGHRTARHAERGVCAPEPGSQHAQDLRRGGRGVYGDGAGRQGAAGAGERFASAHRRREPAAGVYRRGFADRAGS